MQNKIFTFLGIIIIAGIVFLGIRNSNRLSPTQTAEETATIEKSAWSVFEKYLGFLKTHDLVGLKNVTYSLGATCGDPTKTKECFDIMDNAYNAVKIFSEADFHYTDYDKKQIVLSTDFWTNQNGNTRSLLREVIYFYRDPNAGTKIIAYTVPFEMTYITLDPSKQNATSTVDARLKDRTIDTDRDFLPDEIETCSDRGAPKDCIKTNPTKRDSLGDGWWDGVRVFIKPTKTF
mgnify:CR=1 FL=1